MIHPDVDYRKGYICTVLRLVVGGIVVGVTIAQGWGANGGGDCIRRNSLREGKGRVPEKAIGATIKRMQVPSLAEGFDALYYVRIDEDGEFVVEEWAGDG